MIVQLWCAKYGEPTECGCSRCEENVKSFDGRYGVVYLVTNIVNGKRYVGKTIGYLSQRWSTHVSHAMRGSNTMALHGAIRKYGRDSFEVKALCVVSEQYLCMVESAFIGHLETKLDGGKGYNMTEGGDGMSGRTPSPETRRKMSAALIGNKRSLGRKMTDDNKRKLAEAIKGKKRTKEHSQNLAAALTGKKLPPGRVKRMSEVRMKDTCKYGHPRNERNTYVRRKKDGRIHRICRICRLKATKEERALC